jgi:hypothetical protein
MNMTLREQLEAQFPDHHPLPSAPADRRLPPPIKPKTKRTLPPAKYEDRAFLPGLWIKDCAFISDPVPMP